jgi:hypothetical protein
MAFIFGVTGISVCFFDDAEEMRSATWLVLGEFRIFLCKYFVIIRCCSVNPLNAELNPIFQLLALLGAHYIFHVSGLRVNRPAGPTVLESTQTFTFIMNGNSGFWFKST